MGVWVYGQFLVTFENGQIQQGQEDKLNSQLYKDNKQNTYVVAASDNMVYKAEVDQNELYNTFIAIRNKKKNKVCKVSEIYLNLIASMFVIDAFNSRRLCNLSSIIREIT